MKRLISICFLVSLTVMCNAQENAKPNYSELYQDQLNLSLKHASKSIKTGKILTFVGAGAFTIGIIIMASSIENSTDEITDTTVNSFIAGDLLAFGGLISTVIGIPVWIVGVNKKNKIEVELVKFNPKGSASINGIGLKIRF